MTTLKAAVLWCCRLDIPWTAQDVADMADTALPATKAYLHKLAQQDVCRAHSEGSFVRGAPEAISRLRTLETNAKLGGGGAAYRKGKAARDRLLNTEAQARRQGSLLIRTTANTGEPMRTDTNERELDPNDSGLTKAEFATAMRVTVRCVEKWIKRGRVHYCRTPGGRVRIPGKELRRILNTTDPITEAKP